MKTNEQIYSLENGRVYSVLDTGKPYKRTPQEFSAGENEEGGFVIRAKLSNGEWGYICHAENQEGVNLFIKMAERLKPTPY